MKKRIRINGIIIGGAFILIVSCPDIFMRGNPGNVANAFAQICGIILILTGQIIRVSARGYKSEHSQSGHALIESGPYGLVRNPMYLGILFVGVGIVFMLFKLWVVCVFLTIFVIRYILLIFREEKSLSLAFPDTFPPYCKKVPRIFPAGEALYLEEIADYLPLKWSWFKKEIGSILAVTLAVLLLKAWKDIRSYGVSVYLTETVMILVAIFLFSVMVVYLISRTEKRKKYVSNKSKTDL